MPPPPPPSPADRDLLGFAVEHRFVLAAQWAALAGVDVAAAARRLEALTEERLTVADRRLRDEPPAYAITPRGRRAIDSPLGQPRPVDLGHYRHDVGLAWLWVAAHRGRFGPLREIVGERRMRSEDARHDGGTAHGVWLGPAPGGGRRLHHPDLTLVGADGHRVAVELELSTKPAARRERILSAYAADPRIDAVLYLVEHPAAGAAIRTSAQRVGAGELVRVQRIGWADGRGPAPPARTATRRTARAGARVSDDASRTGAEVGR